MIELLARALLVVILALPFALRGETPAWTALGDSTFMALASGGIDGAVIIARRKDQNPVRSLDGGRTWIPFLVDGSRPDRFIASPTDSRVFYALIGGIAVDYFNSGNPSSLYRTRDGGATWEVVAAPFVTPGGAPMGDVVVGASPDLLYAARMVIGGCFVGCAYEGAEVFVSTDAGRNWRSINAGLVGSVTVIPYAGDARIAYAATPLGLFRTEDQGTTWRALPPAPFNTSLKIDRRDPSLLYTHASASSSLWVSEDGGQNWRASDVGSTVSGTLVVDPVITGRVFFLSSEGEIRESRDRARTWRRAAPPSDAFFVVSSVPSRDTGPVAFASGSDRVMLAAWQGTARRLQMTERALFLGSDMWWNPLEAGTGLSITQSATGQVFAFWYGYDSAGRAAWYYLPGGQWLDDRTFSGTLFATSGPPLLNGTFDATRVTPNRIGTGTLQIADDNHVTFVSALDSGLRSERPLTRYLFGAQNTWGLTSYAGLWWNAAEPGWGVAISHQYRKVFAAWYVYDDASRPMWLVVPDGIWRGDHYSEGRVPVMRFDGDLYIATGPPTDVPFDPSRVVLTRIGTASLSFPAGSLYWSGEPARLDWTAFGQSSSRTLSRFAF